VPSFKTSLQHLFRRVSFLRPILERRQLAALARWETSGRPVPPPGAHKRRVIRAYGSSTGIRTLVETGTLFGDTIYALRNDFDRLVSIELDDSLYAAAIRRFRRFPNIQILHGDSGDRIQEVLSDLHEPAVFWLDGHFSGGITATADEETPINRELDAILRHPIPNHIVLIDDARCFGRDPDYPTIEQLREFLQRKSPRSKMTVEDDIIRILPEPRGAAATR
jgi:hypothetical protein